MNERAMEVLAAAIDAATQYGESGAIMAQECASACLRALEEAGLRVVPVEPTPEMIDAGERHTDNYYSEDGDLLNAWRAMLEAALAERRKRK